MEIASTYDVHPVEIRHSLSALQDILNARVFERFIDCKTYVQVNGLIASAKFDEDFNSTCPSIWDISPKDDNSYLAILAALGMEPLSVLFDSKVIPISSDKEHPTTVILVTGTGSKSGDVIPGNSEGIETPQVASWLPAK